MATDLATEGIRINEIVPGHIWTRRQEEVIVAMAHQWNASMDVAIERAEQRIPLGSFGRPVDVTTLEAFLSSPAASFITRARIPVDAGATSA
jgi:3-oxoacyl-[acyl-carrier protein] reductase